MSETKCGHTDMQGFDVVLECVRPPHDDDLHQSRIGQRWLCDEFARSDAAPHTGGES